MIPTTMPLDDQLHRVLDSTLIVLGALSFMCAVAMSIFGYRTIARKIMAKSPERVKLP